MLGAVFTTIQTAAKTKSLPDNDNDDCHYCHASVTISKNPRLQRSYLCHGSIHWTQTQSIIKLSIFLKNHYKHNHPFNGCWWSKREVTNKLLEDSLWRANQQCTGQKLTFWAPLENIRQAWRREAPHLWDFPQIFLIINVTSENHIEMNIWFY